MTDRTQDKTQSAVGNAKGILKGIKGAGDAIRGTVNESVDTAFNDREGEIKNKAIKEKGQADVMRADEQVGKEHPKLAAPTMLATILTRMDRRNRNCRYHNSRRRDDNWSRGTFWRRR
jgi:hypothetical protein